MGPRKTTPPPRPRRRDPLIYRRGTKTPSSKLRSKQGLRASPRKCRHSPGTPARSTQKLLQNPFWRASSEVRALVGGKEEARDGGSEFLEASTNASISGGFLGKRGPTTVHKKHVEHEKEARRDAPRRAMSASSSGRMELALSNEKEKENDDNNAKMDSSGLFDFEVKYMSKDNFYGLSLGK